MKKESKHKVTWTALIAIVLGTVLYAKITGELVTLLAAAGVLLVITFGAYLVIYLEENDWL